MDFPWKHTLGNIDCFVIDDDYFKQCHADIGDISTEKQLCVFYCLIL